MFVAEVFARREVGDGAGEFDDPVVGARREIKPARGVDEEFRPRFRERSEALEFAHAHLTVSGDRQTSEAARGDLPCFNDALAHGPRILPTRADRCQFLMINMWHINPEINAINDWPREFALIAKKRARITDTFFAGNSAIAARAVIHGRNQDETGREGCRPARAGDGNNAVFQRLAKRFDHPFIKLGKFVEEEYAAMSQGDLARARDSAAADK